MQSGESWFELSRQPGPEQSHEIPPLGSGVHELFAYGRVLFLLQAAGSLHGFQVEFLRSHRRLLTLENPAPQRQIYPGLSGSHMLLLERLVAQGSPVLQSMGKEGALVRTSVVGK